MRQTQNQKILDYLFEGKKLTNASAIQLFKCYRLSARIYDLRELGFEIIMKYKTVIKKDGSKSTFAVYYM